MVSLEQIQLLEQKIEIAVGKIVRITEENLSLHREIQRLKTENQSLKDSIVKSQDEQYQIEQGILNVIERLEAIETTVLETVTLKNESEQEQPASPQNTEEILSAEEIPSIEEEAQTPVQSSFDEPQQSEISPPAYGEFETHSAFEPELENEKPSDDGGIDDFEIAPDPQLEIF
jgi:chromosome segregation ATPase